MSSKTADLTNKLFPHHLYNKLTRDSNQQQLLDENYHDRALPKLELAKQALKIGNDTTFATPVEDFGSKILTNLGWKEGCGVGKDMNKQSAPIEYIPRQYRLGLGAKALTVDQVTNKRQLTVTDNYEASSIGKNIKRVGEELKLKQEMTIGSKVVIMAGTHEGLQGEVIVMKKQSALGQDNQADLYVSVQLTKSGATVEIKRKRLQLKRDRSRSPDKSIQQENKRDRNEGQKLKPLKWINEGIIVRCVSKSCYDGRLYGKEMTIQAVLSEYAFEAKCDSKIYSDLQEKDLETVLPSAAQLQSEKRVNVMILRGSQKGKHAKVLHIDKRRDIVEAQIEFVKVVKVSQDDVSCIIAEE